MLDKVSEDPSPRENLLLKGLPEAEYEQVAAELQPVRLELGSLVGLGPNNAVDRFYFIGSGIVSLLYTTAEDEAAEIALIGPEGGVGLELVLAGHALPGDRVVQVDGHAWTLPLHVARQAFARGGGLQRNLLRFSQMLMAQMAQTVVCNRHHSVEKQFVRWLLLSLDRLPAGTDVCMTQEAIAHMLGVRRAGVTEAAGRLQRKGLIEHTRGRIHVLDEAALRQHACECYEVVRSEYEYWSGMMSATDGVSRDRNLNTRGG